MDHKESRPRTAARQQPLPTTRRTSLRPVTGSPLAASFIYDAFGQRFSKANPGPNPSIFSYRQDRSLRLARAREQFLKAIEKNPDWASPYLGLGQTFFFQNNPNLKEATKAFRRVVELKPEWSRAIIGSVQHRRKVEHWRKLSHAIEMRFVLLHPTHDP